MIFNNPFVNYATLQLMQFCRGIDPRPTSLLFESCPRWPPRRALVTHVCNAIVPNDDNDDGRRRLHTIVAPHENNLSFRFDLQVCLCCLIEKMFTSHVSVVDHFNLAYVFGCKR
jgi:hypothetical protein